jgi:hypothetical protein
VKILVYPYDDANPYQDLLYGEICRRGAQISYIGLLGRDVLVLLGSKIGDHSIVAIQPTPRRDASVNLG